MCIIVVAACIGLYVVVHEVIHSLLYALAYVVVQPSLCIYVLPSLSRDLTLGLDVTSEVMYLLSVRTVSYCELLCSSVQWCSSMMLRVHVYV